MFFEIFLVLNLYKLYGDLLIFFDYIVFFDNNIFKFIVEEISKIYSDDWLSFDVYLMYILFR